MGTRLTDAKGFPGACIVHAGTHCSGLVRIREHKAITRAVYGRAARPRVCSVSSRACLYRGLGAAAQRRVAPLFTHRPCSLPSSQPRQPAEAELTLAQTAACQPRPATCLNLVPIPGARSSEQGALRRVVRVEPLQNLLPILPALLVGSQAAGAQAVAAGAGTGAGTAPAALMTDAASQLWKADVDGVRLLAAGCCFVTF